MEEKLPFIYPLSTPNGKYIYDVNRNEVISVSGKVYQALKSILNKEISKVDADVLEEIKIIRDVGYLSDNKVEVIEHPILPYLKTYLERKLQKITLQITQGCNLRCSYCIYSENTNEKQRSHSSKRMSLDTCKQAVDFLLNHSIDNDNVNIGFYGGEPLIEFELIQKIVLYAEQAFVGKNLSFNITSNGTLLNDKIIDFFVQHNIRLMISIDGPPEIHDSNRKFALTGKGSFETILYNLEKIKIKYPDYIKKSSISMVIDPKNNLNDINALFTKYEILKDMNIVSSIVDVEYSLTKKTIFSEEFIKDRNYQLFLAYLGKSGRLDMDYIMPLLREDIDRLDMKIDTMSNCKSLPRKAAPSGPCIPGQLRLFVNADGFFHPCERVSELSNIMQIGSLNEGFNYEKAGQLLNICSITSEECRNCWAFHHCTICARMVDDSDRFSSDLKLKQCDTVRASLKNDLLSMILFEEIKSLYR